MEGYDTRDGGNRGKKGEERWNVGKTKKEEKKWEKNESMGGKSGENQKALRGEGRQRQRNSNIMHEEVALLLQERSR